MGKLSNALMMIKLMVIGKKYSIKELANELEVTPRMVRTLPFLFRFAPLN